LEFEEFVEDIHNCIGSLELESLVGEKVQLYNNDGTHFNYKLEGFQLVA
jgi:hypothetical protein